MGVFKKNVVASGCKSEPVSTFKKTYVVSFDKIIDKNMWRLCYSVQLPVIKINGQCIQNNDGHHCKTMNFQNPWAYEMICAYDGLSKVMGKELAQTIIVYESKTETGKECSSVVLFPTNEIVVYGLNALQNLDFVSRCDLQNQMAKRQKYIDMLKQKQR